MLVALLSLCTYIDTEGISIILCTTINLTYCEGYSGNNETQINVYLKAFIRVVCILIE